MEVSFQGKVACGQVLEALLKGLLEPFPEDRLSAEKVRAVEKREWGGGVELTKRTPKQQNAVFRITQ